MLTGRLLRIAKSSTVWFDGDIEQVLSEEFYTKKENPQIDLTPSFYEVPICQSMELVKQETVNIIGIQIWFEHHSTWLRPPPPSSSIIIDCTEMLTSEERVVITTGSGTYYSFSRQQHREIHFKDVTHLKKFIGRLLTNREKVINRMKKEDYSDYLKLLSINEDPEFKMILQRPEISKFFDLLTKKPAGTR